MRYGASAVTHLDVLRWGTEGSARCLGRDDIGRIAPGLEADLALFTLDEPRFSGAHDPLAALVLCGAHRADRVMIAGRWRVVDGAPADFDLGGPARRASKRRREISREARGGRAPSTRHCERSEEPTVPPPPFRSAADPIAMNHRANRRREVEAISRGRTPRQRRPLMRILLTNDDGIHAPGLKLLERIAEKFSDDIFVVAPETDQSGVAHSLSLNNPLRLREVGPRHFAVQGTPTDCVIMGVRKLMEGHKPDLVLSGVNRGQNVAEDVTYSGTIAGAIEGTLLGIKSIALSQAYGGLETRHRPHWDATEALAPGILQKILRIGIPAGVLINVNFPACEAGQVAGVAVTSQGKRDGELMRIEERHDGRAIPYYWMMFQRAGFTPGEGTDLEALAANKVSVTPLRLDLTDEAERRRYAEAFAAS